MTTLTINPFVKARPLGRCGYAMTFAKKSLPLKCTNTTNNMNKMKIIQTGMITCVATFSPLMSSCDGNDSNGIEEVEDNSNSNFQLKAITFVDELNKDVDFSVTLVKTLTQQDNFIIIYDPLTDSYDAINIDIYDSTSTSETAADYYYANSARAFFDLDVIPGSSDSETTFQDRSSNLVF